MKAELLEKAVLKSMIEVIEAERDGRKDDALVARATLASVASMEAAAGDKQTVDESEFDRDTARLFAEASSIDFINRQAPTYVLTEEQSLENRAAAIKGITDRRDKINKSISLGRNMVLSAAMQNPAPLIGSLVDILPELVSLASGGE